MLCRVAVTFSAIHSAFIPGIQVFISAGASVPGVFWNSIVMPSTSNTSMSFSTTLVGVISPTNPADTPWPRPWPT